MKPISNPKNPFVPEVRERLEPPAPVTPDIYEETVKDGLYCFFINVWSHRCRRLQALPDFRNKGIFGIGDRFHIMLNGTTVAWHFGILFLISVKKPYHVSRVYH